jgi:hypothetical protein
LKHFDKAQTKCEDMMKEKEALIYSAQTKIDNLLAYVNNTRLMIQN